MHNSGIVRYEKVEISSNEYSEKSLLPKEIDGASVLFIKLKSGRRKKFPVIDHSVRILFLIEGDAIFSTGKNKYHINERAVFVPEPDKDASVHATEDSIFLYIHWDINTIDSSEMQAFQNNTPLMEYYAQAPMYDEDTKSKKTKSRSLILQNILPRMCMGSVETDGYDRIEQHRHPYIDQFFYTFPENDMYLLVENEKYHITGNTLVHIPLSSAHGAEVEVGKTLHYLWLDFIIDEEGINYLEQTHKLK